MLCIGCSKWPLRSRNHKNAQVCQESSHLMFLPADPNAPILEATVFSPEFTGQRAQTISHDHTPHLECSDCHYQTFVACVPPSTKHFSWVQCSLRIIFGVQIVFKFKKFKWLLKICWFWDGADRHIVSFVADPNGTLEPPKGTVPFGKGLATTLEVSLAKERFLNLQVSQHWYFTVKLCYMAYVS